MQAFSPAQLLRRALLLLVASPVERDASRPALLSHAAYPQLHTVRVALQQLDAAVFERHAPGQAPARRDRSYSRPGFAIVTAAAAAAAGAGDALERLAREDAAFEALLTPSTEHPPPVQVARALVFCGWLSKEAAMELCKLADGAVLVWVAPLLEAGGRHRARAAQLLQLAMTLIPNGAWRCGTRAQLHGRLAALDLLCCCQERVRAVPMPAGPAGDGANSRCGGWGVRQLGGGDACTA